MTDYFFLFGRCVSADAAAVLASLEDFGSRRTLDAADAAALDVCSFDCFFAVAMRTPPVGKVGSGWYPRPAVPGNADRSRRMGFSPVSGGHGSVHRRALAPISRPRHAVALGAQLFKDGQHRGLAGVDEGAPGHVLGGDQQLFGFGQIFHAVSVPGGPFQGIPFLLSSHDSH